MIKTIKFFLAPFNPRLIVMLGLVIGFLVPFFIDYEAMVMGASTGIFVGLMIALRFTSDESNNQYPIMYGSRVAFSLPLEKTTIVLSWYLSMVITVVLMFTSFVIGFVTNDFLTSGVVNIEPTIGWIHMVFICIIYLNVSSRYNLVEPPTKKKERLSWVVIIVLFLFSIIYNAVFMALAIGQKPYYLMWPITAILFITTTYMAIRYFLKMSKNLEIN